MVTWGALLTFRKFITSLLLKKKITVDISAIINSEGVINICSHEGKYFKMKDAQMRSLHTLAILLSGQLETCSLDIQLQLEQCDTLCVTVVLIFSKCTCILTKSMQTSIFFMDLVMGMWQQLSENMWDESQIGKCFHDAQVFMRKQWISKTNDYSIQHTADEKEDILKMLDGSVGKVSQQTHVMNEDMENSQPSSLLSISLTDYISPSACRLPCTYRILRLDHSK